MTEVSEDRRWHQMETMRLFIAILATALISLGGTYAAFGMNVVHNDQLAQAMRDFSPYAQDRAVIRHDLTDIQQQIAVVQRTVNSDRDYTISLSTRLTVLSNEVSDIQRLMKEHIAREPQR